MFTEALDAVVILLLFLISTEFGFWLQKRLPTHHRSNETIDTVRRLFAVSVTFAALVLGLLVSSVKADFDGSTTTLRQYGVDLIQFDIRLREYGADARPIRTQLEQFVRRSLSDGWPGQSERMASRQVMPLRIWREVRAF